ncbi:Ribonuclease 3 [Rosistilla carotiformis]|uniref:Ribonuclease 3 n=1 Tax=Rosistilla carotiformis TaxID=2528017 RepID=A0A518K1R7_9BACT|nr:ribonuclease III [Rosistilla carotiformis]QDV71709.1 Ribonuclease 3 [Rosistilla carotiformis]
MTDEFNGPPHDCETLPSTTSVGSDDCRDDALLADPSASASKPAKGKPPKAAAVAALPQEELTTEERLDLCESIVGHAFSDRELLLEALTHASGASHRLKSNERMEFLGDAILGAVVCDWLYHERTDLNEGELTKIKSNVVSRQTCSKVAKRLGLDRCLLVGKGVRKNRSFPKSLTSDVFESIVAAIYLDGGFDKVRQLLHLWLAQEVAEGIDSRGDENHKSNLQQVVQRDFSTTPSYRLLDSVGPDHSKKFQIAVLVDGLLRTPAWGRSKKDAEQRAAANALAEISGKEPPFQGDMP